ncbi:MAG: D-alanyl-D-alanine carboxypeptidase [Verrucomicrobiota bacterium]
MSIGRATSFPVVALLFITGACTDKEREAELVAQEVALANREAFVEERGETLSEWADELDEQQSQVDNAFRQLEARERALVEREQSYWAQVGLLEKRKKAFESKRKELLRGTAPSLVAKHAIAVDADTGMVLFEKSAHTKTAVASTQKLLTALLVLEAGDLDEAIVVEESDTLVEPTKLYVKAGESYVKGEVLEALLVRSCNDLAMLLARDHSGSVEEFVGRMNMKAEQLGMQSSNFCNPHGLTEEGQYSTASDMAKLAVEAYRNPTIREMVSKKMVNFVLNDGTEKKLVNTNRVMQGNEYCNGMKTGYTRASGFCLIASGEREGLHRIVVVLGSSSASVWKDAQELLDWALRA